MHLEEALVVPATTGVAPVGMPTGDPTFCTVWTLNGLPAVALPSFSPATGLPIGLQMIGRKRQDARLLQVSRWLAETAASVLVPKKTALP